MANYSGVILPSGGSYYMNLKNGDRADDTIINNQGAQFISGGAVAADTTVNFGGEQHVSSGGFAQGTIINDGGLVYIGRGGSATGVSQAVGGEINVEVVANDGGTVVSGSNVNGTFSYRNGVANNFILYGEGIQNINSGGTAIRTTISEGGAQTVNNGGLASGTIVSSGGSMTIGTGGTAFGIMQQSGGHVNIYLSGGDNATRVSGSNAKGTFSYSNGVARNFIVYYGGSQYVYSGGVTSDLTLEGGNLHVLSGGSAVNVDQQGGGNILFTAQGNDNGTRIAGSNSEYGKFSYQNGVASNFVIYTDGQINVWSGGLAKDTTVLAYGSLQLGSGGSADGTVLSNGGTLVVNIGGTATSINQLSGGNVNVNVGGGDSSTLVSGTNTGGTFLYSRGVARNFEINAGGFMSVGSGGSAFDTRINYGGSQRITSGGRAEDTRISSGGILTVDSGGTALDVDQQDGGLNFDIYAADTNTVITGSNLYGSFSVRNGVGSDLKLYGGALVQLNGGSAVNTTLFEDGILTVLSDGRATTVQVSSGGMLIVASGGKATGITQEVGGQIVVDPRGNDNNALVSGSNVSGSFYYSGGVTYNIILYGCTQTVSAGGRAELTTVSSGGDQWVMNSGVTLSAQIYEGGVQNVLSGGSAEYTSVYTGGFQYVSGGRAQGAIIDEGGTQEVGWKGVASAAKVERGGVQIVSNGGSALGTTVSAGGSVTADSGGVVANLVVNSGGIFSVKAGAVLTGTISIGGRMTPAGEIDADGAEINFAVNRRTTTDDVMITNLSRISSGATYSITVTPSAYGAYKLASGAVNFNKTISVRDTAGKHLGNLSLNSPKLTVGETTYTLSQSGGNLSITLEKNQIGPGPDPEYSKTFEGEISTAEPVFTITREQLQAGFYTIYGDFGNINAYIDVYDENNNLVTGGAINNGVVTFKVTLLDAGFYTISVRSKDGGVSGGAFSLTLQAEHYVNAGDDWTDMKQKGEAGLPADYHLGIVNTPGELMTDYVGYSDQIDYRKITLESAGKLSFNVSADDSVKFTVYELITGKNGTYSLKKLKTITVKGNATGTVKDLLLDSGDYYFSVESTNAKKGGNAIYTVETAPESYFFTEGNNEDDWTDVKTSGAAGLPAKYTVGGAPGKIVDDWVGFGDEIDYRKLELDSAARLSMSVLSEDNAQFTVYQLVTNKNGTYTLKKLKSVSTKNGKPGQLNGLLLDGSGEYYISMKSTNAKKGGNAGYSVTIENSSVYYTKGNNEDDWTDVKTSGAAGLPAKYTVGSTPGKIVDDWVGFGDEIDYRKIELTSSASLSLSVSSSDNVQLTVYQLVTGKNGSYSLKKVKSVSVKAGFSGRIENLLLDNSNEYYFSVKSTNAKKGGNADYSVTVENSSVYYTRGDNGDDWSDVKNSGPSGLAETYNLGKVAEGFELNEWVGFGDAVDYRKFEVGETGFYDFQFEATDNAKLVIYQLQEKSNGTWSLKSLKSVSLSGSNMSKMINDLRLEAGDYYMGITSTNATKGGNAEYSVEFNKITLA